MESTLSQSTAAKNRLIFSAWVGSYRLRNHYLGHLTDVVMVDSHMLASERLGGADYDGDMIKTIADPILNTSLNRPLSQVFLQVRPNAALG